jgi:membrane glycosyltransferase
MQCLPPERPGEMPVQSLTRFDRSTRRRPTRGLAWLRLACRRCLVFAGAGVIAGIVINEMRLVLEVGGLTPLEIVVLVLFATNTVWISLPTITALVGLLRLMGRRQRATGDGRLSTRTALVMPLYNEDPARAGASLDGMAEEILDQREGRSFDFFILSDTTDGDLALAEEEMFAALRDRLAGRMVVYYRRRVRNIAHKSGNIAEFCARWGEAYDHLIVLDADSLMDGATIVELARRMERQPEVGLMQTVPRLHEGATPIAQLQQFAASVYGPVLAAGLAWWTGNEGNYWGHNAIIRCRAFMEAAGLPKLPGQPPLGGYILSHDFVEAALLRRAGWAVTIADDLQGSYESSPSTLIDLSIRDRRWCQGNLQHARVLTARGLHWVSRLHLLTGMMTFISSPFWLLFIIATLALGVQDLFAKPEYFTRTYTLFPLWPHIDPVRALRLFVVVLAILLAPKALGLLRFVCSWRRLRGSGWLLPMSLLVELLLSALIAPVMMLIHCGFVAAVLRGSDSGWKPQRRGDSGLPWSEVAYRHRWHVVVGVGLVIAARSISWQMLAWLGPAVAGMLLAIPVSFATGSGMVGGWFAKLGLLRTPLDADPPPVRRRMEEALSFYRSVTERAPDLAAVVTDGERLRRHLAMLDQIPARFDDPVDVLAATADLKVRAAHTIDEAVARMTAQERAFVQSAPDLLLQLAGLPKGGSPEA